MARKKVQRKTNNNRLGSAFIIFGILLFTLGTFSHFQILSNSTRALNERPSFEISFENPGNLIIPSVGIDMEVVEGGILNGSWILSDFEALYLPTSGKVGEGHNTVIYAHNREGLFKNLDKVKEDEAIVLKDNGGREFVYRIYEIKEINPKNIEAIYTEENNVLTLFTCSGWFDEKRLLVRARLIPSTTQE